ncbi:MAG: chemotaxis response regulator protein-glutamate methylesterase, partial [Vampirovibrionia bacterium]
VDDSLFMRQMISDILNKHPDIEVIDTAANGKLALRAIERHKPDVITLDVEMPEMNGIEALKIIQQKFKTPTIMVSSVTTNGAQITLQALDIGAIDFITKPSGSISLDIGQISDEIIEKVLFAAKSKPITAKPKAIAKFIPKTRTIKSNKIVVIGSSTGGPKALKEVVPLLPADLPVPVLIVQHMPPVFTNSLAKRLDAISMLKVKEAEEGDKLEAGTILLAPGDYHMCLDKTGKQITLNKEPSVWGVRPAVDITLESVIKVYGKNVITAIMTGMGHDGSNGAKAIKKHGGYCIAQDEATCTVFGMPKTVINNGCANEVVSLYEISNAIVKQVYS